MPWDDNVMRRALSNAQAEKEGGPDNYRPIRNLYAPTPRAGAVTLIPTRQMRPVPDLERRAAVCDNTD